MADQLDMAKKQKSPIMMTDPFSSPGAWIAETRINVYFVFKFLKIQTKNLKSMSEETWLASVAEFDTFEEQLANDKINPNIYYRVDPDGTVKISFFSGIHTSTIVEMERDDDLFSPSSETWICRTESGSTYGFTDVKKFSSTEEIKAFFAESAKAGCS